MKIMLSTQKKFFYKNSITNYFNDQNREIMNQQPKNSIFESIFLQDSLLYLHLKKTNIIFQSINYQNTLILQYLKKVNFVQIKYMKKTFLILLFFALILASYSFKFENQRFLQTGNNTNQNATETDNNTETENQTDTIDEIFEQINTTIYQKIEALNGYYTILNDLNNSTAELKNLTEILFGAKNNAYSQYRFYYLLKMKCDGLDAQSSLPGNASQIPTDQCLEFPVDPNAANLYLQKIQLIAAQADTQIAQAAYNREGQISNDSLVELGIYRDLADFFRQTNETDLTNKYNSAAIAFNNTYNLQLAKESLKKQILDQANSIQTAVAQTVKDSQQQLNVHRISCQYLGQYQNNLNTMLAQVIDAQNAVNEKQAQVTERFQNLNETLITLEGITAKLEDLSDKYAAAVNATNA